MYEKKLLFQKYFVFKKFFNRGDRNGTTTASTSTKIISIQQQQKKIVRTLGFDRLVAEVDNCEYFQYFEIY